MPVTKNPNNLSYLENKTIIDMWPTLFLGDPSS